MSETTLPSILLCEDDPNLGRLLSDYLKAKGFETTWAKDGVEGLKEFHRGAFDFIILDVMMPRKDGFQVAEEIRQESRHLPILFLTARSTNEDTLEGFKVGADDYITKPVKPRVLVSRVKALLRRSRSNKAVLPDERFGVAIDLDRFTVLQEGKELTLPKKEFELLNLLWSEPGKVFTREAILLAVWGNDVVVGDRTIDVHIRKLRSKLGDGLITTVKGVGYKFGK